ncbi:MAG: alpha/beta fold hydrolase [Bacteroidia bacterium]|nr:alpha/beta fold hydrolase [Bacteroidia bacterium]MCX7763892.1 alpha/beta fold hydrolase [Bacteroidia bacterium]MDW8056785.1 alpha/beta fold hydrolase [Bacteroidia bacterium]
MLLHFERLGSGEPAYVFLHGFLGSGDNWRTIAKSLSLSGSAYLVDARNHGRSPHAPTHRYPELAQDLIELLDAENIPSAHLLGHSMGGKVGMYAAMHFPDRVKSLVVVDIAPRAYSGGHEVILQALSQVDLRAARREEIEAQLAKFIPDAGVRLFLLKNLARDEKGNFFWRLNLPVLIQEYPHVIAAVEGPSYLGPVLFLRGELSPYIKASDIEEMTKLFPNASIETIPNAGHWVHVDNPSATLAALRRFWGYS